MVQGKRAGGRGCVNGRRICSRRDANWCGGASKLRQDRFLDEARETAEPVRLTRLFGIASHTGTHDVRAAHPERFTVDPTQAWAQ